MTSVNAEGNSSKSKFLAPLVILLLCGAAMTGAAFAYNASLNGNTDVPTDSYVIQFDGKDASAELKLDKDYKLNFDTINTPGKGIEYKLSKDNVNPTFKVFGVDQKGNAMNFHVSTITVTVYDANGNPQSKLTATAEVIEGDDSSEQTIAITFAAGENVTFTKGEIQGGFKIVVSIDSSSNIPNSE
ncbi:MAG: hypothetical protein MJZ21_04645 [archaeon]|nr:hypothetical protein [archaeon]